MKKLILSLITVLSLQQHSQGQTVNTWTQKANLGTSGKMQSAQFSIGNKGYVCFDPGSAVSGQNFWEYDAATDTWTQKADFPGGGRIGATGFSVGTKGYVGLGIRTIYKKDLWAYDPSANTWSSKADFGGAVRGFAAAFVIGDTAYVGTGADSTLSYFKDFWAYNPAADTWTKKADFGGSACWSAVGFSIDGKGYVGTGQVTSSYTKAFWQYDPVTDSWTKKADYGGNAAGGCNGFSIGHLGYIGTGVDYTNAYKADFWLYDPVADSWTRKADFGGGRRSWTTAFPIGSKGYMGCGLYGPTKFDLWQYTPDTLIIHSPAADICGSDTFDLSFNSSISFSSGNIFTAQLSDASGSFASPLTIGTLSATDPDTIRVYIPASVTPGTAYRVRVVASAPVAISPDNGLDLTLNTSVSPTISVAVSDTAVCAGDTVTFTATGTHTGSSPLWIWTVNGIPDSRTDAIFRYKPADGDLVRCALVSDALCRTADSVWSPDTYLRVHPLPLPVLTLTDTTISTGTYVSYQWYRNGLPITAGTGGTWRFTADGDYYVVVTDTNGCRNKSATERIHITGISDPAKSLVGISPNPASDQVTLVYPGRLHFSLYDPAGKVLIRDWYQAPISLRQLSPGLYFLQLADTDGRLLGTYKLIRQ